MTKMLKAIAFPDDIACLNDHFENAAAPARRYGLEHRVAAFLSRGAIYRRYGMFPYALTLSDAGYAMLLADRDRHYDARLLGLGTEEFFGLALSQWRHETQLDFDNVLPLAYWSALDLYAGYKHERAKHAGRKGEAQRLSEVRTALHERYKPERAMAHRDMNGLTVQ